jgi:hypothetical protein
MGRSKIIETEEERKARLKAWQLAYYAKNKEKIIQRSKDDYQKNKESILQKQKSPKRLENHRTHARNADRIKRKELDDSYIKRIILLSCKHHGVEIIWKDITPEQIALQRKITHLRRLIKSHRHEK